MAVDAAGIIYVADTLNNAIRVGTTALADKAMIDSASVKIGTPRQLDVSPQTATSWQWTLVRRPTGSSAVLSSTSIRNPTFIRDVAELYQFPVVATSANGTSITEAWLGPFPTRKHAAH